MANENSKLKYNNQSIFDLDDEDFSQIDELGDSQMSRGSSYQYMPRSFQIESPPSERLVKRIVREVNRLKLSSNDPVDKC